MTSSRTPPVANTALPDRPPVFREPLRGRRAEDREERGEERGKERKGRDGRNPPILFYTLTTTFN